MKLILTKDVEGLGDAGQSVTVKDGYGRNYLLVKQLAVVWSKAAEDKIQATQKRLAEKIARAQANLSETIERLNGLTLEFQEKLTSKGNLYGSIKAEKIVSAIQATNGIAVDPGQLEMEPIRHLGTHEVRIQFPDHNFATVKVNVQQITE
ncbi:MAG: 50S ribosomal protein L9 [Bifidobacteriaceae bacterium]|jgi:large subunit ribosomal protein L9|nr:50S ribosomal protein L9 [Bifidobacteriaceae bacterium]